MTVFINLRSNKLPQTADRDRHVSRDNEERVACVVTVYLTG